MGLNVLLFIAVVATSHALPVANFKADSNTAAGFNEQSTLHRACVAGRWSL